MFEFVEIMPNIYRYTIAAGPVLKYSTNIYLIKDDEASLIIDTGYASQAIRAAISNGLKQLGIDPQRTRIIVTHGHVDHYGNVDYCVNLGMKLLMQPQEHQLAIMLETMSLRTAVLCGLEAERYNERLERQQRDLSHTPTRDHIFKALDNSIGYVPIEVGQELRAGGYTFKLLGCTGHSPCQFCIYEAEHKFLFSADQLLLDTVPVIISNDLDEGLLQSFFTGLDMILELDCDLILPGHSKALYKSSDDIEYAVELIRADYRRMRILITNWLHEQPEGCTALDIACRLYKTTPKAYLEPYIEPKVVMLYKVFSIMEYLHDIHVLKRTLYNDRAVYQLL